MLMPCSDVLWIPILQKHEEKKKRSLWCKDLLKKRNSFSHANLISELNFAPNDWHNTIRINKETYLKLLALVTPIIKKQDTLMRTAISPHERLTATLQYLALGHSLADLELRTAISAQALGNIIPETCEAIYEILHKDYLKFPQTEEEWKNIAHDFEEKWNFPHCLGAMDGKHISINLPFGSGSTYLNYKGGHSMVLLAIANAKCEFIMCDFGTNGRVSDARVLKNTKFFKKLQERKLNIPGSSKVRNSEHNLPYVFVVDDGFPLRKEMMKPFKQVDLISEHRKTYNSRVSRVQRIIENVFAILASRFQILHTVINLQPHKIESVVMACCVLHNFLGRSVPSYYSLPDCFNQESIDAGATISGLSTENSSITRFDKNNPGNTVSSAKAVREGFVNYFVTDSQDNF